MACPWFWYKRYFVTIGEFEQRLKHQMILDSFGVCFVLFFNSILGFPGGSVVKNLPANVGNAGDTGSIPAWERSPGGGNGNPLQYSCLEKSHEQRSLAGYSQQGRKESPRLSMHAYNGIVFIQKNFSFKIIYWCIQEQNWCILLSVFKIIQKN